MARGDIDAVVNAAANVAAATRGNAPPGSVAWFQGSVAEANYLIANLVPMLNTCLTAWQAIPFFGDPGWQAARDAFLATRGSDPGWLSWNYDLNGGLWGGDAYWAVVNQVTSRIAGINDQLATAEANLAAAQSRA